MTSTVIIGTGSYLPARRVSNDDIQRDVTNFDPARARTPSLDVWARRTHGGITRHHAADDEATSDLALQASRRALLDAGLDARRLDVIVMATMTSDEHQPPCVAHVQKALGATRAKFIQVDAACTGFVDAMLVAQGMLHTLAARYALVVSGDVMSRIIDRSDYVAATVFGDGAGAVVLEVVPGLRGYGLGAVVGGSDGHLGHFVTTRAGGSRLPLTPRLLDEKAHLLSLRFGDIFDWAVDRMATAVREVCARSELHLRDVRWLVPHQASVAIVRKVAERIEFPEERVKVNYPLVGNTTGGTVPIALDQARRDGAFAHGDWLVVPAVGAGMAWGAFTYRWHDRASAAAP